MITLRLAGWRDVLVLYRWRNHPTTRAMMRSTDPVSLTAHLRWFRATQRDPLRRLYMADEHIWSMRVGTGRLDLTPETAEVELSVTVAPDCRAVGYARPMIQLLVEEARALGYHRCIAMVRAENIVSRKAFRRCGFLEVTSADATSDWRRMERSC